MFKNREVRVRINKINDETAAPVERQPLLTQDEIATVKDFVKTAALFVGGVYLAGKVVDAACIIAVHHATRE